jgi:hypothetical protein
LFSSGEGTGALRQIRISRVVLAGSRTDLVLECTLEVDFENLMEEQTIKFREPVQFASLQNWVEAVNNSCA